jgi:hypothetical protein
MPISDPLDHGALRAHHPWTPEEHQLALNNAARRAEDHNRRQRRMADLSFFVAAATVGMMLLSRDTLSSSAVAGLGALAAIAAWFALRSGARVRSVGCMIQEWSVEEGAEALSAEELTDLERQSRDWPAVAARIDAWRAAGYVIRQREHDLIVAALRERGVSATPRTREISAAAFVEAL